MKLGILTILATASLVGCGTFYRPVATASLVCEAQKCDMLWQRAQTWLVTNGRYRIQIANDSVIQTFGPHDNVYDAVAYTVTRDRRADGTSLITIRGACYATIYGCAYDPAPLTNLLYNELAQQ